MVTVAVPSKLATSGEPLIQCQHRKRPRSEASSRSETFIPQTSAATSTPRPPSKRGESSSSTILERAIDALTHFSFPLLIQFLHAANPCCFVFLLLPWSLIELPLFRGQADFHPNFLISGTNSFCTFSKIVYSVITRGRYFLGFAVGLLGTPPRVKPRRSLLHDVRSFRLGVVKVQTWINNTEDDEFAGVGARFVPTIVSKEKHANRTCLTLSDPSDCYTPPKKKLAGDVLLVHRGKCKFTTKAKVAEAAGASAILIINNHKELYKMVCDRNETGLNISILAVMLPQDAGASLETSLQHGSSVQAESSVICRACLDSICDLQIGWFCPYCYVEEASNLLHNLFGSSTEVQRWR
ncbi:uncharacterized protein LOC122031228 [Zingiber officinale]|uniref:uncharacterized protein LOC122031228 n=1 Tax=Zingiber officinale TaxID=94328 RepID=UPI001C4B9AE1|nr:uncharacterized protein LOC122031228 [Zingiber officinale]